MRTYQELLDHLKYIEKHNPDQLKQLIEFIDMHGSIRRMDLYPRVNKANEFQFEVLNSINYF